MTNISYFYHRKRPDVVVLSRWFCSPYNAGDLRPLRRRHVHRPVRVQHQPGLLHRDRLEGLHRHGVALAGEAAEHSGRQQQ